MNKSQIRKHLRDVRAQIPLNQREAASRAAAVIFSAQPVFANNTHIACYMAYNDEFNLQPMINAIWQANKICYLPVLLQRDEKSLLRFAAYHEGDKLHRNRYGILEPDLDAHAIELELLEVVITPLIAFDREGHRLGTGGGYYDQTLAELTDQRPWLIGAGYAVQEIDALPKDPWDVKLNAVITEKEYIELSRN